MNRPILFAGLAPAAITLLVSGMGHALAADTGRFLKPKAWQCSFTAEMDVTREEQTGPGGMANDAQRGFLQMMAQTGVEMDKPGGNTDSYREVTKQTVKGRIRLHYIYDGGPDGLQLAGWDNGSADVTMMSRFEGTEQHKTIIRERTASFEGKTSFYGDEYSPGFDLWIFPDQGTYSFTYSLAPVSTQQVEHCRMAEGMEADRRKAESATDADMPLGGMMSELVKSTCATETVTQVELEGGAFSGLVEDVPLPRSGNVLEGEGQSAYSASVNLRWSCRPE